MDPSPSNLTRKRSTLSVNIHMERTPGGSLLKEPTVTFSPDGESPTVAIKSTDFYRKSSSHETINKESNIPVDDATISSDTDGSEMGDSGHSQPDEPNLDPQGRMIEDNYFDLALKYLWEKKKIICVIVSSICCVSLVSFLVWKLGASQNEEDSFRLEVTWDTKCGISNKMFQRRHREIHERIIGGSDAELGEFPWIARVMSQQHDNIPSSFGGTIIHKQYVLTAAHCCDNVLSAEKIWVHLGEYDTATDPDCSEGHCAPKLTSLGVENIFIHENFIKKSLSNDICLLKLTREIPFSEYVKPICLPTDDGMQSRTSFKTGLVAAGWGFIDKDYTTKSSILQKAELEQISTDKCALAMSKYAGTINDSDICTGSESGVGTCPGDSGTPLMYKSDNGSRYYIVGVTSTGRGCSTMKYLVSVFARVGYHMPWINKVISQTE